MQWHFSFSQTITRSSRSSRSSVLRVLHVLRGALCMLPFALASLQANSAVLGTYNVKLDQTSVSGISAGANMAVQFGVANSSIIKGVGVISGAPYYCAHNDMTTALSICMIGAPTTPSLISTTDGWATAGYIDPTANIAKQKIWMFHGYNDGVIKATVEDALYTFYKHYTDAGNIYYKNNLNAGHAMITASFGTACTASGGKYVNNCGYDAAGLLLEHIYGALNAKNTGTLSGTIVQFDQSAFYRYPADISMAATGYAYIPASCAAQQPCRVHIALHGCQQSAASVGNAYHANAGYNQWADTNNMIVLYPQATSSSVAPLNPNACFDWWGYNGSNYAQKGGAQIAMIKAMLTRVSSGYTGWTAATGGAFGAPTSLVAADSSASRVALFWNPVGGAKGYNVFRNSCSGCGFSKVNAALVTSPSFADTGLAPNRTYYYYVTAVNSADVDSPVSATVSKKTAATPPLCDPYFRDNYTQWLEGRADMWWGFDYAKGSGQYMGMGDLYDATNLVQTKLGYFVIGTCN
jgi:poly(3-hydroxybutyrate) depolymerase